MRVHTLHLPHFHGFSFHAPRLPFSWPYDHRGLDLAVDALLLLIGAILGLLLFVPGALH